jgi:hypothetical protein
MKIIRNNIIPFPGYKCINLFGILFARKKAKIDEVTINHESIHSRQFVELMALSAVVLIIIQWWLIFFAPFAFYVWYAIEWLVRLSKGNAYRSISFEREAYTNENDMEYLSNRRHLAFIKYLWY